MTNSWTDELTQIEKTIADLHTLLNGPALASALQPLLEKQSALQAKIENAGVAVQESSLIGGHKNIMASQAGGHIIYAEEGSTIVIGEIPHKTTTDNYQSAIDQYLRYVISYNRYLQLQGIRSGGRLVHIELDQIYITLRTLRQIPPKNEGVGLLHEADTSTSEQAHLHSLKGEHQGHEMTSISVNEALQEHRCLVVLGDPGSGKTTLMRYLALLYARSMAEKKPYLSTKLGLAENDYLPVLLYLRQIGAFLKKYRASDDGTEGASLLLDFFLQILKNERIILPEQFFEQYLQNGRAVILLDGLDEVADTSLRRRVARLIESFYRVYPNCRYVVTSRIVGYTGPARLGENFITTTVRDFSLKDVERFLSRWHRLIMVAQKGNSASAEIYAKGQTRQLLASIESNKRIKELSINPLMLTVVAMVHRDRVKLPDRRAELYAEAVDVLLGKWDEARGVEEVKILDNQAFDTGDRRLMLQNLALKMHMAEQKEITIADLRQWLSEQFYDLLGNWKAVSRAIRRFLWVIEERTGVLVARGNGIYAFSHLTFQEYLAAVALAGDTHYIAKILKHVKNPWWREVILLVAGYLSTQSREKTIALIQAIAKHKGEKERYDNLVLAAYCLRDVGINRVSDELHHQIQTRLKQEIEKSPKILGRLWRRENGKAWIEQRSKAMEALVEIGSGYWQAAYGEPEWVEIPGGEFWLGEGNKCHRLHLNTFLIARTPITNAQYYLFIKHTGYSTPAHWEDSHPPRFLESHPVVNVTWDDALNYCQWLSRMMGENVSLPSEAEWEKAARGHHDKKIYPWGNQFETMYCNSDELGLEQTTPVGVFPNGASIYGCLDMSGNVWEWTRSIYKEYPYQAKDGREEIDTIGDVTRVLRGGSYLNDHSFVRCTSRDQLRAGDKDELSGFRVLISPR